MNDHLRAIAGLGFVDSPSFLSVGLFVLADGPLAANSHHALFRGSDTSNITPKLQTYRLS